MAEPAAKQPRTNVFARTVDTPVTPLEISCARTSYHANAFSCNECDAVFTSPAELCAHNIASRHEDVVEYLAKDLEIIRPHLLPGSLGARIAKQYMVRYQWSDGTPMWWGSTDYYDMAVMDLAPLLKITDAEIGSPKHIRTTACLVCDHAMVFYKGPALTRRQQTELSVLAHHPYFTVGTGDSCWVKSYVRTGAYCLSVYLQDNPDATVAEFMASSQFDEVLGSASFQYTRCFLY
jgi:hypothetical protein